MQLWLKRIWWSIARWWSGDRYVETAEEFADRRPWLQKTEIPTNYSDEISDAQGQLNRRQLLIGEYREAIEAEKRQQELSALRVRVGVVRLEGYDAALAGLPIAANPYPKGSGAAQQWVRGYCAARNIRGDDLKEAYRNA